MSKSIFFVSICLLLLSHALPVFADQYDDCVNGCNESLTSCINQSRLTAGNVQEEQDLIAACENNKADCTRACSEAEATPQTPSGTPPQTPSEEQPLQTPQQTPSEEQPPSM